MYIHKFSLVKLCNFFNRLLSCTLFSKMYDFLTFAEKQSMKQCWFSFLHKHFFTKYIKACRKVNKFNLKIWLFKCVDDLSLQNSYMSSCSVSWSSATEKSSSMSSEEFVFEFWNESPSCIESAILAHEARHYENGLDSSSLHIFFFFFFF